MIEMSKDYRNDLYDVYVSYPPQVDRGLIRECLKENLGEEKAEGLIESLDSKPQVLVEENALGRNGKSCMIISAIWVWILLPVYGVGNGRAAGGGEGEGGGADGKCPNILNFTAGGKMIFPHLRSEPPPAISNRWFSGC